MEPVVSTKAQGRARLHKASRSGEPGRKAAGAAQRASALSVVLSAIIGAKAIGGSNGRERRRWSRCGPSVKATIVANAQSRARLHKASRSGEPRRKAAGAAQRASALSVVLSAIIGAKAIGGSNGRERRRWSRCGPSVKAASVANAQSRASLHKASRSGEPGRKAARAAQRASALSVVLSAVIEAKDVGGLNARERRCWSRCGQSANATIVTNALCGVRSHRASPPG